MSSEVDGLPTPETAQDVTPVRSGRRPVTQFVRHILARPLRPVLVHQALVNRNLARSVERLRESLARVEAETARSIGDLNGSLRGELADLQLGLRRLETRLIRVEQRIGDLDEAPLNGSESASATETPPPRTRIPPGAGVNLIGDLTATTGLAQAGRRLAVGLQRRGVPISATSVASGAPRIDELMPDELRGLPNGTPFPVDLVTLNVNEVSAVAADSLGATRTGRHAIGAWYWEFETLTPDLIDEVDRIDEIWAPTTYVESILARYTTKPIHIVPTIVPVFVASDERGVLRRRWGLSPTEVVFLFSFDFNSSVVRKNPLGVIEAYHRAFGSQPSGARLVMKAINLANSPRFESDLRAALGSVGGVLIDEHLSSQEFGDLFHAADVYVSLHRSEGFGLGMAEAMAIGKAVVGTAYSGNVDFMHGSNSCPVGYRLRPITDDDHRYNQGVAAVYRPGFLCAEPDLGQAARWMQVLASDVGMRERIGGAAAKTMANGFSERAAVDTALALLEPLWQ